MLITGGWDGLQSAEIYHIILTETLPLSSLIFLTGAMAIHRMMGHWRVEACGHADYVGAWDMVTASITGKRYYHTSWTPADGSVTYLMGGQWSYKTSEVIDKDNGVTSSFPLQHWTG